MKKTLLLFLVLNLTACATATGRTQVVSLQPNDVDQFDLILVTRSDGTQLEVENPSVENNDELVGTARTSQLGLAETGSRVPISIPLADIETIETVTGAWLTGAELTGAELATGAAIVVLAAAGVVGAVLLLLIGMGGGFGS